MANTVQEITTAVEQIAGAAASVLIPDTCSILDIIRSTFRKDVQGDVASAAQRLLARANGPQRSLWIVVPEQVCREWNDHKGRVTGELETQISRLEWEANRLAFAAGPVLPLISFPRVALRNHNVHNNIADLAQRFLDAALIVREDDDCNRRAHGRVVTRVAPAHQNQQYKDCVILEHALALGSALEKRGFTNSVVFVTSNHTDYGPPATPKAPLDQQFAASKITYVSNLAWAESLV